MNNEQSIDTVLPECNGPVLIISTHVGRGVYTLGEVIKEKLSRTTTVYHIPIEHLTSSATNQEDVARYRWISNTFPFLLRLIYTIPLFYYRKFFREKYLRTSDLTELKKTIESLTIKTVICVSHRPAFWVSNLKRKYTMPFSLWGILAEYGYTLGWRYIFWEQVNAFFSPFPRQHCPYPFPAAMRFYTIALPVQDAAAALASQEPSPNAALIVCGYWGQGPITRIIRRLTAAAPDLTIHAVCGENAALYRKALRLAQKRDNLFVYSAVPSLIPLLKECASVITKPGLSTILEVHAAQRKLFLLKGMPIAEDNNARYALQHFDAEWFSVQTFIQWRKGCYESTSATGLSQS